MYLAHGPISYMLNEIIQKKNISKLNKHEQILIAIFSILFGILPDIDLAVLSITNIPPFLHHSIFTHSALFYISLWILLNILIYILKKILNKESRKVLNDKLLNILQWSFLIGTLSHFLADLLFSYSQTLFPIQKQFTILGDIFSKNYFASLIFTPPFATEIFLICIFFLFIFKKYFKDILLLKLAIYLSIFLTFVYLIFTMYMNINIYNKTYMVVDGKRVLDIDFDGVLDMYDSDTKNNGILNIYELDVKKATSFLKEISNGKYFVSSSNDIKYYFGALNSYRVISQTYNEQNLAIEPVLREYSRVKNRSKDYNHKIPYSTLLFEYLNENTQLELLSNNSQQGNIFFVLENQKVVNMGILVEEDMLATVLKNDDHFILHTVSDIQKEYPNTEIKVVNMK